MKEFFTVGVALTALLMPGNQPARPVYELDRPAVVEGFLPRERITVPPVQTSAPDDLLPDFGSPGYL